MSAIFCGAKSYCISQLFSSTQCHYVDKYNFQLTAQRVKQIRCPWPLPWLYRNSADLHTGRVRKIIYPVSDVPSHGYGRPCQAWECWWPHACNLSSKCFLLFWDCCAKHKMIAVNQSLSTFMQGNKLPSPFCTCTDLLLLQSKELMIAADFPNTLQARCLQITGHIVCQGCSRSTFDNFFEFHFRSSRASPSSNRLNIDHMQKKTEAALFEIGEDLALLAGTEWNDPWVGMFGDVLLRRIILHFLLCRAALSLHKEFGLVDDYQPTCFPPFPQV